MPHITRYDQVRVRIAEHLKQLMLRYHYVQTELARRSGVPQKTISNMLQPDGPSPSLDKIEAVSRVFGMVGWQLLLPELPASAEDARAMRELNERFLQAPAAGKQAINRLAKMEADHPDKSRQ